MITLDIVSTAALDPRRDFTHLRWWREIVESVVKAAIIAGVISFGGTLPVSFISGSG